MKLSDGKDEKWLDTLAAAYAESGNVGEAISWQTKAMALDPASEQEDYRSRLELYRQEKPYREEVK